jgi:hypothetical protein
MSRGGAKFFSAKRAIKVALKKPLASEVYRLH